MVATPIGNLGDITLRAIDVLKSVDVIAAEDTRHTSGLLAHLGIQKKLMAVHEHNEQQSAQLLLTRLQAGESIALVTDAGTPGISDPGAVVVKLLIEYGVKVVPVPGASALVAALSVSGIAETGFQFVGFLPATGAQRRKRLEKLRTTDITLVFYEAPHRILACVQDMSTILGEERIITIARELTKAYETIHRCQLKDAEAWLQADLNQQRGEFVLVLERGVQARTSQVSIDGERVLQLLLDALPLKQAVKLTVDITGANKNEVYAHALTLKNT